MDGPVLLVYEVLFAGGGHRFEKFRRQSGEGFRLAHQSVDPFNIEVKGAI